MRGKLLPECNEDYPTRLQRRIEASAAVARPLGERIAARKMSL
jgi:hypothetical protein